MQPSAASQQSSLPLCFYAYPTAEPAEYREGDDVFVWLRSNKATGRAVVLGPSAAPPQSYSALHPDPGPLRQGQTDKGASWLNNVDCGDQIAETCPGSCPRLATTSSSDTSGVAEPQRIPVRYLACGSYYNVRVSRFQRVFRQPRCRTVVLCAETKHYRRLARSQVDRSDFVIEIGSSFGVCTDVLAQHAGRVIGIEHSAQLIEESRRRYPGLHFELLDALNGLDRLATLAAGCTTLFVDIGGNRQLETLVQLLPALIQRLAPQVTVVKSRELSRAAAEQCQQRFQAQQTPADVDAITGGTHCLSQGISGCNASAAERPGLRHFEGWLVEGGAWWQRLQADNAAAFSAAHSSTEGGAQQSCVAPQVEKWFAAARANGFSSNPLRHPVRQTPDGTPICRLHNYNSCKNLDICRYDHTHCHYCGQQGHIAVHCPDGS